MSRILGNIRIYCKQQAKELFNGKYGEIPNSRYMTISLSDQCSFGACLGIWSLWQAVEAITIYLGNALNWPLGLIRLFVHVPEMTALTKLTLDLYPHTCKHQSRTWPSTATSEKNICEDQRRVLIAMSTITLCQSKVAMEKSYFPVRNSWIVHWGNGKTILLETAILLSFVIRTLPVKQDGFCNRVSASLLPLNKFLHHFGVYEWRYWYGSKLGKPPQSYNFYGWYEASTYEWFIITLTNMTYPKRKVETHDQPNLCIHRASEPPGLMVKLLWISFFSVLVSFLWNNKRCSV